MDPQPKGCLKPFCGRKIVTLLGAWVVLVSLAFAWGEHLGGTLVPIYQWGFEQVTPYYLVNSLTIEEQNGETLFTLKALTTGNRRIGSRALPNGYSLSSSTLLAHALQPAIVLYLLLLIWPMTARRRAGLFILSMPVLLLVELVDVPLVLLGAMEDLILANFNPGGLKSSFAVQWMNLMNGGGRMGLGFFGFALTLAIGQLMVELQGIVRKGRRPGR